MKKFLIVLFLGTLFFSILNASETEQLFLKGNSLYESGDYSGALQKYEKIIEYGIENPDVYYNLGNTFLKLGKKGKAVLNYEKAYKLSSNDRDIQFNLELARLQVVDKAPEESPFKNITEKMLSYTSVQFDMIVFLIIFWLFGAVPVLYYFYRNSETRRIIVYAGIILFLFSLLSGTVLAYKYHKLNIEKYAVIISPRVDIRSGPGESNPVLFQLHEGLKVKLVDSRKGWSLISIGEKMNGWVLSEKIGII